MSYTAFKDGYAIEATYGTAAITTAGSTAYLPGLISQELRHPNPRWRTHHRAVGVGAYEVPAGAIWKSIESRIGTWQVVLQNGIPLWMAQGGSSTADDTPSAGYYTHTITADDLPSFTTYHERTGTGTDWVILYTGCMVGNLTLQCSQETLGLLATIDWVSQNAADPNLDGTNATLTNDPALPATANTEPYLFSQLTRTWDYGSGNVALDGLEDVKLTISPGLQVLMSHYWDSGTNKAHIPRGYYEAPRRDYQLEFIYHPENDDVWDALVSTSNAQEFYLKWTRDTKDYIAITCTDCQVIDHDTITPRTEDTLLERVIFEPRSLSISVVDQIAGGSYGE